MIDESLETPDKVRELQIKLYRKAKSEPGFRFYLLYDKIHRADVLQQAWLLAKANDGAPGVDNESFEDIELKGRKGWLNGRGKELRDKTYRPQPAGEESDDSETGRGRATAGYPDHTGPGGANRREVDPGTDL